MGTKNFLAVLLKFWKGLFHMLKRSQYITVIMTYYHNIALSKKYINLIRFVKKGGVLLQSTCTSGCHVRVADD